MTGESTRRPKGQRGVAYLRVSSDKQDQRSQRESVERWLAQHGLTVDHWYSDVGSRDLAYKRPDFQRLIKAVEANLIDWIVVDAKDRFGTKNANEFGRFCSTLQDHDVELWSTTQGCLTDDNALTEITNWIDSQRGRDEQRARSQRTIRGKVAAVQRGEWQGGYPPFGFDIACVGADGREKWRLYYTGTYQREKYYADGRPPERYDGKGAMPGRDAGDTLRLVPSRDARRIEWVRKIFQWVAEESISLRAVCQRLNDLGVKPSAGDGFYSSRLKPMLKNPTYVTGMPVWNKQGHGRFFELVGDRCVDVPRRKGRAIMGRVRAEADYVTAPTGEAEGLIDRTTWDRVQAKLKVRKATAKAPRNPDLWLSPFVYCGHCGGRMSGWHQRAEKTLSYTCSTYRKFAKSNATGCRLHRIRHEVIERLVERYLEESGRKLDTLLAATDEAGLLAALDQELDRTQMAFLKAMTRVYREVKRIGAAPPPGKHWSHSSLCRSYRESRGPHREQLIAKEAEMERLIERFAALDGPAAVCIAKRKIAALEREITELRHQVEPLADALQATRDELVGIKARIVKAQASLGNANRRKTEALGRVLARIVCYFTYRQAGTQDRSILSEVVFEPLLGDGQRYDALDPFAVDNQPARG